LALCGGGGSFTFNVLIGTGIYFTRGPVVQNNVELASTVIEIENDFKSKNGFLTR
jgi:hypothetical protein